MHRIITTKYFNNFDNVIGINRKNFNTYKLVEDKYDKYSKAVDKLVKSENENEKDLIKEYITDGNIPKRCSLRGKVNDMIDVIDLFLHRTIQLKKPYMFKFPMGINGNRDAISINGIAGSGKSWWIARYCELYMELYPSNTIYLITANVVNDKEFKKIKHKKLVVTRDIISQAKFDEGSFPNSLVILDDIESSDDGINLWIRGLRDMLFEKSRKHNTVILSVSHKALCGRLTVKQNLECNGVVVFPRHSPKEIRSLLNTYFDLNETQIKKILAEKINSRWVYVSKVYPRYYITDKKIQLIDL